MEQGEYQSSNRISILTKELEAAEASSAAFNNEKEALLKEVGLKMCRFIKFQEWVISMSG